MLATASNTAIWALISSWWMSSNCPIFPGVEHGNRISRVRYTLYHSQDVDVINTAGGNSVEVQGLRSIDGKIQVSEDDTAFSKALENRTRLTLHMEKGQEVDFYIVNAGGQGEFSIAGDGDLHRSSA